MQKQIAIQGRWTKIFILVISIAIYTPISAKSITIAVAANVSYAIDDLKSAFGKLHPEIDTTIILGSSGKLTAQIRYGAPYDLLMSADMRYPKALYDDGLAISEPIIYAKGALALLSTEARDFSKGLSILQDSNIEKIAIANPKTAPYGIAAAEALREVKLYQKLKPKFIYGESVSQTLIYAIKASDIGLVAKSSLYSPRMSHYKEGINWIAIDSSLYSPIAQGMVILKATKSPKVAEVFYKFMLSDTAKNILRKFGYQVP